MNNMVAFGKCCGLLCSALSDPYFLYCDGRPSMTFIGRLQAVPLGFG